MKLILFFITFFFLFSNGQNLVRLYYNYPNLVGALQVLDFNPTALQISRFAQLVLGVPQAGIGEVNLVTPGGYVAADDVNVYSTQSFSGYNPAAQEVVLFNHQNCLANYIPVTIYPITSVALDPNNMYFYITFKNTPTVLRENYDGTGSRRISYPPFLGTNQMLINYNTNKLYFVNNIGDMMFYSYDLNANVSTIINTTAGLTGGIAVDLNTGGKVYFATQGIISSYNPSTGIKTLVYSNADYTIRGMTIDSVTGLLFFAADSLSMMNSNVYVVSITLPAGTVNGIPQQLRSTQPKQFVSMAIAHCPPGACGPCGVVVGNGNELIVSVSLIILFIIGLVMF